jgi:peptidoglycan L-alanyl-D-glutamate endopeptidase CwlK
MYQLGTKSRQRLVGVHPDLVKVVQLAITLTVQDFSVLEGLRSIQTQREYFARGASQTMASRHLKGRDGYGHAVDLVAWLGGLPRWEWPLYTGISDAMRRAAIQLGTPIRWGGGWFLLNDIPRASALKKATDAYTAARRAAGKKAFLDGPHFELPSGRAYP